MRSGRGPGENQNRRGGRRGGRNGSRGRLEPQQEFYEDVDNDAAVGKSVVMHGEGGKDPTLDAVMEEHSRKRTEVERGSNPSATPFVHVSSFVDNQLSIVPAAATMVSPPIKRDPKKASTEQEGNETLTNVSRNLAGSFEGRRHAQ